MNAMILIVDDEKAILSYLATVLAGDGHKVLTAGGGAEALEIIREEDIDLVLCDLMMPDINGLQVMEQVREQRPDASIVMVTAYGSLRSAVSAMRLGAADYILKPFDEEELRFRVNNALEKHLLKKEYDARTREVEAFIFAISHDIGGHLVALRGFARRLRTKWAHLLSEDAICCLDRMDSSTEKMERLVKAISDFAMAGAPAGDGEMVDVGKVVQDVLQSFQSAIEEKRVEVRVASDFPTIETEWVNAYQIFHNLVGNAIKFCREDVTPLVEIEVEELEEHYRFCVRDNGIGVRPEDRDRIFEMFGRGGEDRDGPEGRTPGTGLGLAIAKRVVGKMGGRIWVESEEERGSAFFFTLPKHGPVQRERAEEKAESVR